MKIVADAHLSYVTDYFEKAGELTFIPGRQITAADVQDADMLIVRSVTDVNAALLQGSSIKFVGSMTAGADHLDTDYFTRQNIQWSVASGFNAPPVADYVVSVIAGLQRIQLLTEPKKTAAVIGVGRVGRLVVEKLKLLGFDVIVCDPIRANNEVDFNSMALTAITDVDLVSIHVPLTKSGDYPTHHFINEAFMSRQKPGCVMINASRGSVVKTDDLLEHGKHLYWCLDVFEHEPAINKVVLEKALIATPHIAGYSVQSKVRGIKMIYDAAKQAGLIHATNTPDITMPTQTLTFAGGDYQWQDLILGVFNPMLMTAMMRSALYPAEHYADLFDKLRHDFNYRHELQYTTIHNANLTEADHQRVNALGMAISN